MTRLTHLPRESYETRPWKNGKGVTTDLYRAPAGADDDGFELRVSLAAIPEEAPFSAFPGVERRITLIEGAGLALDFGDRVMTLRPFETQGFDSGATPTGRPIGGPVRVVNVMARRARWRIADCRTLTALETTLTGGSVAVFFALSGQWSAVADGRTQRLNPQETLLAEGPGALRLRAERQGRGVFAQVEPAR